MFQEIPVGGDRFYTMDGEWNQVAVRFNSGPYTNFKMHNWLNSLNGDSYLFLDDMYLFETVNGLAEMPDPDEETPEPTQGGSESDDSPSTGDSAAVSVILMIAGLALVLITSKKRQLA